MVVNHEYYDRAGCAHKAVLTQTSAGVWEIRIDGEFVPETFFSRPDAEKYAKQLIGEMDEKVCNSKKD